MATFSCSVCGYCWSDSHNISICPNTRRHARLIAERVKRDNQPASRDDPRDDTKD